METGLTSAHQYVFFRQIIVLLQFKGAVPTSCLTAPSFFISAIGGLPPPALFHTSLYQCQAISGAVRDRCRAIRG